MIFTNAKIFCPDGVFRHGIFCVNRGRFARSAEKLEDSTCVDLQGRTVLPGLIDIHTHGIYGYDFSAGEGLETMMRAYARHGVTSVVPASMTVSVSQLTKAYEAAAEYIKEEHPGCARLSGINMEGPFFSYGKRGAQNPDFLLNPDYEVFDNLNKASGGMIKIVCVAPELPGGFAFIEKASKDCAVSVAHTECDYETASRAFAAGATHLTHLYNGMPGIHHRNAGPIGAGAEAENVFAELICDGLHVSPAAVRIAYKLFPGRICIISDSLACCGLPEGTYDSGGMTVYLKDNLARLADGTIAGSVCNVYEGMRNCIRFGIDAAEAILSATANPARQTGIFRDAGSIEEGKLADFLVCDEDLALQEVYIGGQKVPV